MTIKNIIMEITSSVVLPVSSFSKLNEFSKWVLLVFSTHARFVAAMKSALVDDYIKTHILPEEMNHALRISQQYIGEKWGDANIQKMLLDRRRVMAKMKNLKEKIAILTFPVEEAQLRKDKKSAAKERREEREAIQLQYDQQMLRYAAHFADEDPVFFQNAKNTVEAKTRKEKFINTKKECLMEGECAICLKTHKMTATCSVNCGHQFGKVCLKKWKNKTCPLCRTAITELKYYKI